MKLKSIGLIVLIFISLAQPFFESIASSKEIHWQAFATGLARGKFEKKKVFLHFYAAWCAACDVMENKTFKDSAVIASLNDNFIPIKVDVDRDKETSAMFRVQLLPDTWFLSGNGEIIGHRPGFIPPEQLKIILKLMMEEDTGQ
jgi:thiol:disulfide interchange protein